MNNVFKAALLALCVMFCLSGCSDDTVSGTSGTTENMGKSDGGVVYNDAGFQLTDGGFMLPDGLVVMEDGGSSGADGGGLTDVGFNQPDLPFMTNPEGQVLCGSEPCACSDGKDNDGDGKIDGFDPECTGAYDNDEGTFSTGIPGDNKDPKWQDCFFDGNSGSGDDGCRYQTGCLTGDLPSSNKNCQVTQKCTDFCQRYTPNGCDCFGCCEVFKPDGTSKKVIIGNECSTDKLDDESACQTCVQSTQCLNPCGTCELCAGKTLQDLPAECFAPQPQPDMGTTGGDMGTSVNDMGGPSGGGDMGTPYTCEGNIEPCGADGRCRQTGEGTFFFCLQGCCYENPG